MKNIFPAGLFLFFFVSAACAQFEGTIDMKVTSGDQAADGTILYKLYIKGNLMASEMKKSGQDIGGGRFVFRGDRQVMWIINDAGKNYLEFSLKDDGKVKPSAREKKKPKITRTGKRETISGYQCEEVIIEDESETAQILGTSKLGDFYKSMAKAFHGSGSSMKDEENSWEAELMKLSLFPMRLTVREDGNIQTSQEVVKVEPKSLPMTAFEVPKDYKKQKMDTGTDKLMEGIGSGGAAGDSSDEEVKKIMEQMQKEMKKFKEKDPNDPGMNTDLEKIMKQVQDEKESDADTSDGGKR